MQTANEFAKFTENLADWVVCTSLDYLSGSTLYMWCY